MVNGAMSATDVGATVSVTLSLKAAQWLQDLVAQRGMAHDPIHVEAWKVLQAAVDGTADDPPVDPDPNWEPVLAEDALIAYGRLVGFQVALATGPNLDAVRGLVDAYRQWLEIVDRGIR